MYRFSQPLRVAAAASLISLFATQPVWAWGTDGHRIINRLAVQYLPADVPAFLRNANALDVVEYLGPEPDRWRSRNEDELSQTQAPEHFIDLEWARYGEVPCAASVAGCGADGKMFPRRRYDFIRALAAAQPAHPELQLTPEKIGLQPWQTEEVWQRLKADMREYRGLVAAHKPTAGVETAILFDCGWLGHYVGDGSMPLHTSIEYNGWVGPNPNHYTTDHYIHGLFESTYVAENIRPGEVAPLVAASQVHAVRDEWTNYLAYLEHSHTLVEPTYQLEKAGAFAGAGTPEGKAFVEERLAAGAIQLRDMIASAWVHSAEPVPPYRP